MSQPALLNRTHQSAFLDNLQTVISSAGAASVGLLVVQLKSINDLNLALGYRTVDAALSLLASRLAEGFSTRTRVVRVGTGRFAIVLDALKSEAHALLAANKVQRLVEAPFDVQGCKVKIDVVQGVALFPQHAANGEDLFRCAEGALDLAKNQQAAVVLYSPEKVSELNELHRIDGELTRALEHGGLEVVFQPQIELRTGRPTGAEALLRCRDRDGAPIPPQLLIQAAERTQRLPQVMAAVLNTALRYAAEWPDPLLGLSVNASADNFKHPDFVASIESASSIWNRAPGMLTVEVTESAFIDEPEKTFATMRCLRNLGVRVSIDDFGTGYSSLSYFKDIPANELKVDKSFVIGMVNHEADRGIVRTIINLAHAFGLQVVAEGVEDEATLDMLRSMDCDVVQGFLLSKPLEPASFLDWLRSHSG